MWFAAIHSTDRKVEEFLYEKRDTRSDRFSVEGIIPRALLERVARNLLSSDPTVTTP